PQSRQAAIFEAFEQADASTTRRYGGTGLGLTISRKIVEHGGGRIWLESEEGRGTRFHFTLCVQRAPTASVAETIAGAETGPARSLAILLAEDNAVNQRLAVGLLHKLGHTVTAVGTGREALAAIGAQPFDLAILDVQMPELDGLDAAREWRAIEA